ncbi:MAG: glycosyltransferase [Anaerolineae bacterium]|nr:glycosyltransferase [Anaerolineae bacterium]
MDGSRSKAAYLRGIGRVRRALATARYDLIHAHYVFSGMVALVGRRWRVPILLTHHGIETQRSWTAPLCRWTSRCVERTVVTSRRVRDALGRPDVEIVPCGVDTDLFQPVPQAEARAALGLPPDQRLVLFAGMRRPEKRFDLVEAAVNQVQKDLAGVRLLVAEAEPHERMPLFMNAADVLILASEAEGSPMVIKEAMACNLPIVAVDVGDVAEVIGDTAGCFVVQRDVEALAEGLRAALAFGRRTAGRQALFRRPPGAPPLTLTAVAERLEAIYRELAGTRASGFSPGVGGHVQ